MPPAALTPLPPFFWGGAWHRTQDLHLRTTIFCKDGPITDLNSGTARPIKCEFCEDFVRTGGGDWRGSLAAVR